MPYHLLPSDLIKVQAICTQGVQTALNNVYFRVVSLAGAGLTDLDVAQHYDNTLAPLYKNILTSTASWYGCLVQKVFPLPQPAHEVSSLNQGPGGTGGTAMPGEVCSLLALRTGLAGRAFRGRIYLPFIDYADVSTNEITVTNSFSGRMGVIGSNYLVPTTVVVGGNAVTLQPVIFHRKANKAGTTTPNSSTDLTGFAIELVIATQRKRSARGRANSPPV